MTSIAQLEEILARETELPDTAQSTNGVQRRIVPPKLTLQRQMVRDEDRTIVVRTGLSIEQFTQILNLLRSDPEPIRRGPVPLDLDIRLIVFLQWLRFGQTYKDLGDSFHLHRCRVQSIITDLWTPMVNTLQTHFLPAKPQDYHPTRTFDNFPQAIGALDATLIRVTRPSNSIDAREYLSGKHRAYGIRLQVLTAPDGRCIHYGGTISGRRHDIILYEQSRLPLEILTTVTQGDGSRIPMRPAILADGGYAGIHTSYPEAIIPKRRRPNTPLRDEDREFNRLLSHDRVVVERFFGRLKGYWGILKRPLRIDKVGVDGLLRILVCLTNLKIQDQPLSSQENIYCPDPEYEEESEEEAPEEVQDTSELPPTPQTQGSCLTQTQTNRRTSRPTSIRRGKNSSGGTVSLRRGRRGD